MGPDRLSPLLVVPVMGIEDVQGLPIKGYPPTGVGLGALFPEFAVLLTHDGSGDRQSARTSIEVVPSQAAQLATASTGYDGEVQEAT
jgi:hypothetical protein